MGSSKPFTISQSDGCMKAFKAVKANAGSAGIDKQSIERFEQNLKDNLYQDLEPDVVGDLFPASGESRGPFPKRMAASEY